MHSPPVSKFAVTPPRYTLKFDTCRPWLVGVPHYLDSGMMLWRLVCIYRIQSRNLRLTYITTHEIPGHKNEATLHDFHTRVCGPYVITLLNWTSIIEWYMARFVIKNAHQKDSYVLGRYWLIRSSIMNTIRRAYVIIKNGKESCRFDLLTNFKSHQWF